MRRLVYVILAVGLLPSLIGCGDSGSENKGKVRNISEELTEKQEKWGEIAHLPLDSTFSFEGEFLPEYDSTVSFDGNGSIKVDAYDSLMVNIGIVDDIDIQQGRLYYRAMLRTEDFDGEVYLEMRIDIGTGPQYYTRDQYNPLVGTKDWERHEAYMILTQPQYIYHAVLQLNICGKGTVWIDDIHLYKTPLKEQDIAPESSGK